MSSRCSRQRPNAVGCDGGHVNLGSLYAKGQGVAKDHELAVSHSRKAAGHEEAGAQFNLALSYARGQGVDHDLVEAHKWAVLAADQGLIDAGKVRDSFVPYSPPRGFWNH